LIRNNPVTCVQYYKNRMNSLRQLISHDLKYYGELKDHLLLIEFQNRGSQHDHALIWINYAPIYGRNTNIEIKKFVNIHFSTDSRVLANDVKTIQHHHHTITCRKNKKFSCMFNFPIPLMRKQEYLKQWNLTMI
jgi:hypothetical protein